MSTVLTIQEYDKLKDSITGIIAYSGSNPCIASVKVINMLVDNGIIEVIKEENKDE